MTIDEVLTELEKVSADAIQQAGAGDVLSAAVLVERRGALIRELTAALAQSEPLSPIEFNRLVVIHHQGNRIAADLQAARVQIANEFVETSREHAYLECISGLVDTAVPVQLNEQA